MSFTFGRRASLAATTAASVLTLATAAQAEVRRFEVPAQEAGAGIRLFAQQAGLQVMAPAATVANRRTRAVRGDLDLEVALGRLLEGTGLRVSARRGDTIVLTAAPEPARVQPAALQATVAAPPPPSPPATAAAPELAPNEPLALEEVVVTATRQQDTVNRVPLSISAQTQRTLDQRGIRSVQDLEATVPALRVTQSAGGGTASVAIRGVVQSNIGAATTGLYLDETPLQRRNTAAVASVNGTPLPGLFDLQRVEVLRGPQGTLFGGSSQGGTIRFIQTAPSLTRHSAYGRASISTNSYGDPSYETSYAFGGPLIEDRLGFRLAASNQVNGGLVDIVNPITRRVVEEDSNRSYRQSIRGALLWKPTDGLDVQLSFFGSRSVDKNTNSASMLPLDRPLTVPSLCYNTRNTPAQGAFNAQGINTSARVGPVANLPFTSGSKTTPNPVGRGDAACATLTGRGDVTYQTPGYTLGPYALEPFQRVGLDKSSLNTSLSVTSLEMTQRIGGVSAKWISSYLQDNSRNSTGQTSQIDRVVVGNVGNPGGSAVNAMYGDIIVPSGVIFPVLPGIGENVYGPARFTSRNGRYGFVQELRFASDPGERPLSWVAGLFYSNIRSKTATRLFSNSEQFSRAQFGIGEVERYTIASIAGNGFSYHDQSTKDVDVAGFGEANVWLTESLRLIAGVRWTRTTFSYSWTGRGPTLAIGPDSPNPVFRTPSVANNGFFDGQVTESPITPKLGLNWEFAPNRLVYATASKGYRAGGVNTPVGQAAAGDSLARNFGGATVFDLPRTYASDSVWSYEAGAKVRLFNRIQVNASVYRIDWKNTQFSVTIPQSGQSFVTNVEGARLQGGELEIEAALMRGLSVYGSGGYSKGRYTEGSNVRLTNGGTIPAVLAGQALPQPKYSMSAGGRYDFALTSRAQAYVRADWRYTSGYELAPFGTSNWNPDSNVFPSQQSTNVRAGVELGDFDVNLFVNNLFDADDANITGGRSGCALPAAGGTEACTNFTQYQPFRTYSPPRPREIGLQLVYRR